MFEMHKFLSEYWACKTQQDTIGAKSFVFTLTAVLNDFLVSGPSLKEPKVCKDYMYITCTYINVKYVFKAFTNRWRNYNIFTYIFRHYTF